jgi:hypothetical protein
MIQKVMMQYLVSPHDRLENLRHSNTVPVIAQYDSLLTQVRSEAVEQLMREGPPTYIVQRI